MRREATIHPLDKNIQPPQALPDRSKLSKLYATKRPVSKRAFVVSRQDSELADRITTYRHVDAMGVLRGDVLPWILAGAAMVISYVLMVLLVMVSLSRPVDFSLAAGHLATPVIPLAALGSFLALRSKDTWTWALAVLMVLWFSYPASLTLATYLLPGGILKLAASMLGFLAVGRIIQYLYLRHVKKFNESALGVGGWVIYLLVVFVAIAMNSRVVFELFWSATH